MRENGFNSLASSKGMDFWGKIRNYKKKSKKFGNF
jgi:hypothetical protein